MTEISLWKELLDAEDVFPESLYSVPASLADSYSMRLTTNSVEVTEFDGAEIVCDDLGNMSVGKSAALAYLRRPKGKPEDSKVHFTYCQIIFDLPAGKFFCTNRSDGKFEVDVQDAQGNKRKTEEFSLRPCQFCIGKYFGIPHDGDGIKEKKRIAEAFDYAEILAEIDVTLNVNVWRSTLYQFSEKSWEEISREARSRANWTCEKCKIYVGEEYAVFLHAHHKHADRNFNHSSNIESLCIRCHAEEPGHESLKNSQYDRFMLGVKTGKFKVE